MKLTPIIASISNLDGSKLVTQDGRMLSFYYSKDDGYWVAIYNAPGKATLAKHAVYSHQVAKTSKSLVRLVVDIALG